MDDILLVDLVVAHDERLDTVQRRRVSNQPEAGALYMYVPVLRHRLRYRSGARFDPNYVDVVVFHGLVAHPVLVCTAGVWVLSGTSPARGTLELEYPLPVAGIIERLMVGWRQLLNDAIIGWVLGTGLRIPGPSLRRPYAPEVALAGDQVPEARRAGQH